VGKNFTLNGRGSISTAPGVPLLEIVRARHHASDMAYAYLLCAHGGGGIPDLWRVSDCGPGKGHGVAR